jgi:lipopolysaccharide export LptBFGC system permease protein LptF
MGYIEYTERLATSFHNIMKDPENRGPNFDFYTFDIELFCQNFYIDRELSESEILALRTHARKVWDSLNSQYHKNHALLEEIDNYV